VTVEVLGTEMSNDEDMDDADSHTLPESTIISPSLSATLYVFASDHPLVVCVLKSLESKLSVRGSPSA
jgi:hypothetical protein